MMEKYTIVRYFPRYWSATIAPKVLNVTTPIRANAEHGKTYQ